MTYGHDDLHPHSGDAGTRITKPANDHGWRDLDASRRLALIEQALGHRQAAA